MEHYIQAGKFKAECLRIMEEVKATGTEYVITKRQIPIAKLIPIKPYDFTLFGKMKGTVHFHTKDIMAPIDEEWDANY